MPVSRVRVLLAHDQIGLPCHHLLTQVAFSESDLQHLPPGFLLLPDDNAINKEYTDEASLHYFFFNPKFPNKILFAYLFF